MKSKYFALKGKNIFDIDKVTIVGSPFTGAKEQFYAIIR